MPDQINTVFYFHPRRKASERSLRSLPANPTHQGDISKAISWLRSLSSTKFPNQKLFLWGVELRDCYHPRNKTEFNTLGFPKDGPLMKGLPIKPPEHCVKEKMCATRHDTASRYRGPVRTCRLRWWLKSIRLRWRAEKCCDSQESCEPPRHKLTHREQSLSVELLHPPLLPRRFSKSLSDVLLFVTKVSGTAIGKRATDHTELKDHVTFSAKTTQKGIQILITQNL